MRDHTEIRCRGDQRAGGLAVSEVGVMEAACIQRLIIIMSLSTYGCRVKLSSVGRNLKVVLD